MPLKVSEVVEPVTTWSVPPFQTPVTTIPGLHAGSAYASGDALGTRFSLAVPVYGTFVDTPLQDLDKEELQVDFFVFNRDFTGGTDDSPFAPADADLDACIGVIAVSTFFSANASSMGQASNLPKDYIAPSGRLWFQAVTRGAPNLTAVTDYKVSFVIVPYR